VGHKRRNPSNPSPKKGPQTPGNVRREDRKAKFLEEFGKHGFINRASTAAGIHRDTVREWRENDAEFDVKFRACNDDITENLEAILYRRAHSDQSAAALIFALKARSPEKYTERRKIELDTKAFESFVAQVTGVIKRRVTDSDIRDAIARDLMDLATNVDAKAA
jgi:hypothetical protein